MPIPRTVNYHINVHLHRHYIVRKQRKDQRRRRQLTFDDE